MTYFIAEVSSNHSKNKERAFSFIDTASQIGCKAVKFQLFKMDKLFSAEVMKNSPEHIKRKNWELPLDLLPHLSERCKKNKIQFGCTPFYIDAVYELERYVDFYKVASYELLWDDLLIACARTNKPLIVSTGMANMDEINHAVDILRSNNCTPRLLHCTSAYPTPHIEANLSAIETIRRETGCEVGWSDHTVNSGVIHRAIHKWNAKIIEFHLDLDGHGEEYSSGHCWLPDKIKDVIQQANHGYEADGDGEKIPVSAEADDRLWRADPSDGLRPLKSVREKIFEPKK